METTVPSYFAARASAHPHTAILQDLTKQFWAKKHDYEIFISEAVRAEVSQGDAVAAAKRLAAIRSFPSLEITLEVEALAKELVLSKAVPAEAASDATHLAVAAWHQTEFIVTWNFAHIANAQTMHLVEAACLKHHRRLPRVVTPQYFLND